MNFLLFFITSSFSAVIFIFYKLNKNFTSISGSLLIDSIIFLGLAFFLFFYFSSFKLKLTKKNNQEVVETKKINISNIAKNINFFKILSRYIYYIGFLLFYSSIYLIFYAKNFGEFNSIILFLNILILFFFFLYHKLDIIKDFIRINTIIFSLYYIILFLYIFISNNNLLDFIDYINTFIILSLFLINFYINFKNKNLLTKNINNSLVLYFFIYSFVIFSFYFKFFINKYLGFFDLNIILIIAYISVIFNIVIYFILQKLKIFFSFRIILRALSFLFGYIAIIFSSLYLFKNISKDFVLYFFSSLNNFLIITFIIYLIFFNFRIHKKFQNYICLFFSLYGFVFLLNYILYKNLSFFAINFIDLELILNFSISFFIVIFTYIFNQKYIFDYYFLHFCAYLVNILGISFYLYFGNFKIFNLGIILLLDSFLIFISYFKLKNLQKNI